MNGKVLLSLVSLLFTCLFLAACSDDEPAEPAEQSTTEDTDKEAENAEEGSSTEQANEDSNSAEEESDNNTEEFIENQSGLKIGETGTVVSGENKNKYEVTLNEVRYEDMDNVKMFNEVFVVVDVTFKNIDDKTIDSEDLFMPSFGELGTNVYDVPVGAEFVQDVPGIEIVKGEIKPGESVTGNYVFDASKSENYHFAIGTTWDDITTRAEWEISEDEVK